MANEITLAGQFAPYGGNTTLTIAGSSIGSAAASIISLEGSGSARGYKIWKSGQADFLNTLKQLVPNAIYIVNAKTLPMDFPGIPSIYPLPVELSGPNGEAETLSTPQTVIGEKFRVDPASISFALGSGTVLFKLNSGSFVTGSDFNTLMGSIVGNTFTWQVKVVHSGACKVTFNLLSY